MKPNFTRTPDPGRAAPPGGPSPRTDSPRRSSSGRGGVPTTPPLAPPPRGSALAAELDPPARRRGRIARVADRHALAGQLASAHRLAAGADGVHEIGQLLGVAAHPVLDRVRELPARPGLDLLADVLLAPDRHVG